MAGTPIEARGAKLGYSTDSGVSYTDAGGITKVTPSFKTDQIEVTDSDSAGNKEYINGLQEVTFACEGNYEEDDTVQSAIITDYLAKTQRYYRVRPQVGSGKKQWTGKGNIESLDVDLSMGKQAILKFSLKLTGAIGSVNQ